MESNFMAGTPANDSPKHLGRIRTVLAVIWFGGLLAVGFTSRVTDALRPCTRTMLITESGSSTETSSDGAGGVTGTKNTKAEPSVQTTGACVPIGVAELAAFATPGLFLLMPILKGFNVAGLFGLDFQDVTEKAARAAEDQTIRLIIANEATARTKQGSGEVQDPGAADLPPA